MPKKSLGININTLAEEAGVSVATISRVMNRRTGVSEETRHRIEVLLRRHDFKPDREDPRPARIALLTPWRPGENYLQSIIAGAYDYAAAHRLDINVVPSCDIGIPLIKHIRDLQCSGVIIIQKSGINAELQQVLNSELPAVLIDCGFDFPGAGTIAHDAYTGTRAATEHLLSLGHKHIGFMKKYVAASSGQSPELDEENIDHRQRFRGYIDAMAAAGISPQNKWVINGLPTGKDNSIGACGVVTMRQLLRQAPELTAVMTIDDGFALGAMRAIRQNGLKIPEDFSLVGFGNYFGCQNWYPALTTINHPVEYMGFLAAEAIARAFKSPRDWIPPQLTLPSELIIRESTGPAKHI